MLNLTEFNVKINTPTTELIDQVVEYYKVLCEQEKNKHNPDWEAIAYWEIELFNLGQEKKASRLKATRASITSKVNNVYYPFLKSIQDNLRLEYLYEKMSR